MSTPNKVKVECPICKATGVRRRETEMHIEGMAVVCEACKGVGYLEYTPFTERKILAGITTVAEYRGLTIFHYGPGKEQVTYEEFLKGNIPGE